MNLVIRDALLNPPTWFLSFRDLTLYCRIFLKVDTVVETEEKDIYYRWLKPRGGMDFVGDLVRPGEEQGLRLDLEPGPSRTIVTDRIAPENIHRLISQIKGAAR